MSRRSDDVETKASVRLPGARPVRANERPRENATERLDPTVVRRLIGEAVKRNSDAPTQPHRPAVSRKPR